MARQTMDLVDPRLAKALSHPMRTRILAILNERVASPNEISEMIDERLPNVSYHVRALQDLGCIELVSTAQRRGAIEHYYRAVVRPFFTDRDWKKLPQSGRQAVSDVALQMIWEDVSDAIKSGTFEGRPDRHLSRSPLQLDETGWKELAEVFGRVLEDSEKIEARSRERIKKSGADAVPARAVMMLFESPVAETKPKKR
jgi:DNA-binding transcriptional ArsR family regulator